MRFLLLSFFTLFSSCFFAQGKIGPSISINNTWLYNANILNAHRGLQYKFSMAPTFGISHVFLGDIFRYRTGLNYNSLEQKLYAEYWHDISEPFISNTRLNFAELPLYMGFENENAFFFEIGLNAYYLLNVKESIEFSDERENIIFEDLKHDFKQLTLGFGSAIGKEFGTETGTRLSLSGEFQFGFSDITKQSLTNGIFDSEAPNSFLNAMAHDGFQDLPQVSNYKSSSVFYLGFRMALLMPYD